MPEDKETCCTKATPLTKDELIKAAQQRVDKNLEEARIDAITTLIERQQIIEEDHVERLACVSKGIIQATEATSISDLLDIKRSTCIKYRD